MKLYFDEEALDAQLQRSVGKVDAGMATAGECLAIAAQVTPGDRDSWYRVWSAFAARLVEQADAAAADGRRVSARSGYLRACEYFRQAFFFHREDLDSEQLRTGYRSCVTAFRSALDLLDRPARVLDDPLSGYLFLPNDQAGPFPTVLHIGGYDATAEELYAAAYPALERGYAFAAVDGPGQGAMLYDHGIPMRPDWENVIPGMVDALIDLDGVDPERIVLVGRSFGGLLAPRGAAGEHRLAALIVDPGQYDAGLAVRPRLGPLAEHVDDPGAEAQFEALLERPAMRAMLGPRMATHGVTSVREFFAQTMQYTNAATAGQITCPTFVTDNETDLVSAGQGQLLYDALTCPKQFRRFTKDDGAEGHCEILSPLVFWTAAYDWLDAQVFARG